MIVQMKMKGNLLKTKKIIGVVKSGGFSSKFSYLQHLIEETLIRIHNKQSLVVVIIIFFNAFLKNLLKIIKEFFNYK
jgi:hypothetical protein